MDRTLRIEELLNEAGWLRHLAASLVGDRGQAEDLVQDTWVAALRRPPREGEPRPWLARVLRNRARNAGRDSARREAREEFVREERLAPDASALAQEAEAQRLLAEAVTRLDEPLRAVIVLRYFQGVDSSAAAARLGVPASTLRTRLQRALEALRADLDRREGGRTSWAALLVPLARGAGVGASSSAIGATAALVVSAGAACLVALLTVAHQRSSADERVAAITSLVTQNTVQGDPALVIEAQGATPVPQDAREPVAPLPSPDAAGAPGRSQTYAAPQSTDRDTAVLSGTILVDGRAPEWPIALRLERRLLRSPAPPSEGALLDASRLGRTQALLAERGAWNLDVAPEARGEFTFAVPREGGLALSVTDFTFVDGTSTLELSGPTTGLVVNLRSDPEIVGRLVDSDGAPIADIDGRSNLACTVAGRPARHEHEFRTRADGRFRIPSVPNPEQAVLSVVVESETRGYLSHESPPFVAEVGTDLGDLRLEPVRSVAFHVRSADGTPIERVFACVEPTWTRCKPMTCPGGSGKLAAVPDREVTLRFGAYAHADRTVRAVPGETLEVELERLTTLEVRLLDPNADHVMLSDERPLLHWDDAGWSETPWAERGVCWQWRRGQVNTPERRYEYGYWPDDKGRLEIAGLKPGLAIVVEARDAEDHPLASSTVSLAPGEHAVLELGTPGPAKTAPAIEELRLPRKQERP